MSLTTKDFKAGSFVIILLPIWLFMLAACSPTATEGSTEHNMYEMTGDEMEGMEGNDMHGGEEDVHEGGSEPVSNSDQGATIRLISPEDGATYLIDEEIPVEVEIEGFALGEGGRHWHVIVDGATWGMSAGNDNQQVLVGLEPGMRKIEVSLSGGDHADLDSSDSVTIMIERREEPGPSLINNFNS